MTAQRGCADSFLVRKSSSERGAFVLSFKRDGEGINHTLMTVKASRPPASRRRAACAHASLRRLCDESIQQIRSAAPRKSILWSWMCVLVQLRFLLASSSFFFSSGFFWLLLSHVGSSLVQLTDTKNFPSVEFLADELDLDPIEIDEDDDTVRALGSLPAGAASPQRTRRKQREATRAS